jgi:hypothetical protein
MKKRLLVLSFSRIIDDARVMKQVREFTRDFAVVTCGYGPAPEGVVGHVRIPDEILHNVLHDGRITRKAYHRAYWSLWSVKWAKKHLKRRTYDIVLANDVEAVPLALWLEPRCGVHADLHEYSPLLHEDWEGWREKITPYVEWLCEHYVSKASSWTTVSGGLAREYEKNFGFAAELATNAAPYQDASPTPVGPTIRLVHSGAALQDRRLHDLIGAIVDSKSPVTLDFYLTPNQPAYVEELRRLAGESGGRVRIHDPVPYDDLAATLRGYDVGVHVLAPTNFNNRWALPNKLFDYVQARLGVIVGPSPEMASYVEQYSLGAITADFEAPSLTAVLDAMTREDVMGWKAAAAGSARALSSESQVAVWRRAIDRLAAGR